MILIDSPEALTATLRRLKTGSGLSVAGLARRCGVSKSQVESWLDGTRRPNAKSLTTLLGVLGYRLAIVPEEDQT